MASAMATISLVGALGRSDSTDGVVGRDSTVVIAHLGTRVIGGGGDRAGFRFVNALLSKGIAANNTELEVTRLAYAGELPLSALSLSLLSLSRGDRGHRDGPITLKFGKTPA
ncbi:hypothetical protein Acy02nite_11240 [Actinoplanes cyaneus]|uniref:Uncharacterized protein n=1 Tax=Actinoplanes cyaneus TaxID=52696 RepID=A0A919ICU9_9ACTN|nr:hypothetical protein Acy02nite_11240 [Actinoplanes cyaneus]